MEVLLIAGLWLDGKAWDAVTPTLETLGHRPRPVTLPGQGDGRSSATLDEQLATGLAAVDATVEKPLLVAHSAACTLGWLAADARPERVAKLALIGGFPNEDGQPYADFFEMRDGAMPFPGWGPFEGCGQRRPRRGTAAAHRSRCHPRPRAGGQGRGPAVGRAPL